MAEFVIMPNHIHGIIAIVGVPLAGTRKTVVDMPKRVGTRQRAGIKEYIITNPAQWATDHENPFKMNHHTRSRPL